MPRNRCHYPRLVAFRTTEQDWAKIEQLAAVAGLPVPELLRAMVKHAQTTSLPLIAFRARDESEPAEHAKDKS